MLPGPGIPVETRSTEKISEHSDRILAQNLKAFLVVVVMLAGDAIFGKCCQEV